MTTGENEKRLTCLRIEAFFSEQVLEESNTPTTPATSTRTSRLLDQAHRKIPANRRKSRLEGALEKLLSLEMSRLQ